MGPQQPKVSIVIPSYNRAHCIGNALRMLDGQTFRDFEILIVDDASTDKTTEILEAWKPYEPRLKVIRHSENQGIGGARNTGIAAAKGDYIALLDDDDAWDPTKLAKQVAFLDSLSPADRLNTICMTDYKMRHMHNGNTVERRPSQHDIVKAVIDKDIWVNNGSTMLAHRDVYKKVGPFDTNIQCCEDREHLVRCLVNGIKVHIIPEFLMTYSWDPDKLSRGHFPSSVIVHDKHKKAVRVKFGRIRSLQYTAARLISDARVHFFEGHYMAAARELTCALPIAPRKTAAMAKTMRRYFVRTKLRPKLSTALSAIRHPLMALRH